MMTSQSKATPDVALDDVGEELDKVLSSEVFQGSERSRTLLRFVVEQSIGGQTGRLKEYTLGTEALGKGPGFDPRTDPVVRTEVSRLRTRLDKYYATEGRSDPVVITLPKGSYVPRFEHRTVATGGRAVGSAAELSLFRRGTPLLVAASALVAALMATLFVYQDYQLTGGTTTQLEIGDKAKTDAPIAIAVLPFLNLSGDTSQDYLADGMTEEITAALARVPGLTVLARASAFDFKARNRDARAIGEALGARYLIEGSVRRAGDRLRISAQMTEQATSANVWTGNYDRQLADLFRTQEEIAQAVAASLREPLGLRPYEAMVSYRPADNDTYELFLRGRAAFRARSEESVRFLEQVVARDPSFAPGWALLAQSLNMVMTGRVVRGEIPRDAADVMEARASAEAHANMVIALAPDYAGGYAILAAMNASEGKWHEAMDYLREAIERDPYNPETLNLHRNVLRSLGYLKEALEVSERLHVVEPLLLIYERLRGEVLAANGMTERAISEYLRAGGGSRVGDLQFLMPAYAELGRFGDAVEAMSEGGNVLRLKAGPYAAPLMDAATEVLRALANKSEPPSPLPDFEGALGAVYLYTDAPERMFEFMESDVKYGGTRSGFAFLRSIWWPMPASLRKTERFKALVREAGLVDYWRSRGWPDLCRPIGADDFACE
jgi:TolB-like protein